MRRLDNVIKEESSDDENSLGNNSDDEKRSNYSEIAADDSREYFLGATYYLNELKN